MKRKTIVIVYFNIVFNNCVIFLVVILGLLECIVCVTHARFNSFRKCILRPSKNQLRGAPIAAAAVEI